MIIKTNQPIMQDRVKITNQIAQFWNNLSDSWNAIWGEHIHHGYYENNQLLPPQEAQEKLIEKLLSLFDISPANKILDVGCGMGGSSIYLAKKLNVNVVGITLSSKQVEIATRKAKKCHVNNVTFKIADALRMDGFADNSFDIVWSLESCEQFFDKKLFLEQAYRVLKPGGKLMLATWCSGSEEYQGRLAKKYKKLCYAFDLPYMPTIEAYRSLLNAQHFSIKSAYDWSDFVKKSWDVGVSLIQVYSFLKLIKMGGWRGLRFAKQIKLMQEAFHEGWVKYGVFIAGK